MKVPCTLPALWRCDMLSSLASVITTPPSPTRCLLVTFGDDCSLFSIWMNMIVFMYFHNHNGGDDHDHHGGDCADDNNDQGDDDDDDDDDGDDDEEHDDDDDDDHDYDDDDDNANLWSLYTQHAYTKSCPPWKRKVPTACRSSAPKCKVWVSGPENVNKHRSATASNHWHKIHGFADSGIWEPATWLFLNICRGIMICSRFDDARRGVQPGETRLNIMTVAGAQQAWKSVGRNGEAWWIMIYHAFNGPPSTPPWNISFIILNPCKLFQDYYSVFVWVLE